MKNYLGKLEVIAKFVSHLRHSIVLASMSKTFFALFVARIIARVNISRERLWGFFCQRVVDGVAGTREVSIVDNPEDKTARVTEHIIDDGIIRDQLTWKKTEMDEEETEKYDDRSDNHLMTRGISMTADDSEPDYSEYFPE